MDIEEKARRFKAGMDEAALALASLHKAFNNENHIFNLYEAYTHMAACIEAIGIEEIQAEIDEIKAEAKPSDNKPPTNIIPFR